MKNSRESGPGGWWLLLLIPAALAVLLLYPAGGEYSEGFFVEGLASLAEKTDEQLAEFALRLRWTCGTMFTVAFIAAIACWFGLMRGFRKRLFEFDSKRVLGFRGLFGMWLLFTLLAGFATGLLVDFLSPLNGEPVLVLGILALSAAILGGLQYIVTVFGIRSSRRLFRGK